MLQESRSNKKFDELIQSALKRVEAKGYEEVKSVAEGYENPFHYQLKNSEVQYIPDITAQNSRGKFYFEIAQRTDDVSHIVSKWKLLSTMAKMKNGNLTILIPYGQNRFAEQIINEHDIDAKMVKMN